MARDNDRRETFDCARLSAEMVERQNAARGVRDMLVLGAMNRVPREKFVPEELAPHAYEDQPLPIPGRQTISQPYIVADIIEALALQGGENLLEVGAGSVYAAAVLGEITKDVFAIERVAQLATTAAGNLSDAGYTNVHVRHDDGTEGCVEEAPFDAILVSVGTPRVPRALLHQLRIGGRMVIPIGTDPRAQELIRITRPSRCLNH